MEMKTSKPVADELQDEYLDFLMQELRDFTRDVMVAYGNRDLLHGMGDTLSEALLNFRRIYRL